MKYWLILPLLVSLFIFSGHQHNALAQGQSGVYVHTPAPIDSTLPVSPFRVSDRFGNAYSMEEILLMPEAWVNFGVSQSFPGQSCTTTKGYFNLFFEDMYAPAANFGFNDSTISGVNSLGEIRRAIALQVFNDLEQLLDLNAQRSGSIATNIVFNSSWDSTQMGQALAYGSAINVVDTSNAGGILDGTVWTTLLSGRDFFSLYSKGTFAPQNQPGFINGYIRLNFDSTIHYAEDITIACGAQEYDLYTIILSQAFHLLGIESYMDVNGDGLHGGYYSRFDSYLHQSGNPLISGNNCYQQAYQGGSLASGTNCGPAVFFEGTHNASHEVYTPATFDPGRSLSHLGCDTGNGCAPPGSDDIVTHCFEKGPGWGKRKPSQGEVSILCDLGYRTSNVYGSDPSNTTIYKNTYTSCSSNQQIVVANDYEKNDSAYNIESGQHTWLKNVAINDAPSIQPLYISCIEVLTQNAGLYVFKQNGTPGLKK